MTRVALREHPAKYPKYVFDRLAMHLRAERRRRGYQLNVLDPFAGVGRIHDLPARIAVTVGVEIEPEWAACRSGTIIGDATALPSDWSGRFDAVVTSPCYGNRMADHHEARDACRECGGTGVKLNEESACADAPWCCPGCGRVDCVCGDLARLLKKHNRECETCRWFMCSACGGRGVTRRYTYRHVLGRMPSDGSAASMAWGHDYRQLHAKAWKEAHRVLRPGGLILVNVKNHLVDGREQRVVEFHIDAIDRAGFHVERVDSIRARGMRFGKNFGERVENEQIIVGRSR